MKAACLKMAAEPSACFLWIAGSIYQIDKTTFSWHTVAIFQDLNPIYSILKLPVWFLQIFKRPTFSSFIHYFKVWQLLFFFYLSYDRCFVSVTSDENHKGPVVWVHEDASCLSTGRVKRSGAAPMGALNAAARHFPFHPLPAVHTLLRKQQRWGVKGEGKEGRGKGNKASGEDKTSKGQWRSSGNIMKKKIRKKTEEDKPSFWLGCGNIHVWKLVRVWWDYELYQ